MVCYFSIDKITVYFGEMLIFLFQECAKMVQ